MVKQKKRTKKKNPKRQTGKSDTKRDKARKALHPGKRISEAGNVYYERRKKRSDKDRRTRI